MLFCNATNNMSDQDMRFLYAWRIGRRNIDADITQVFHLAPAGPGKADGKNSACSAHLECRNDIWRVARRRYADKYIAIFPLRLYLSCKQLIIPIVIADSREDGSICTQGNAGQTRAVKIEPPYKLC